MRGRSLTLRIAVVRLGFWLGHWLPLRPGLLFATSHDDELRGNLAIVDQALHDHHPEIPVRRLMHRPVPGRRGRIIGLWRAFNGGFDLARARLLIVDDYYFPLYVVTPRSETTVVQTWHACGAFKRFGYSVLDRTFGADEAFISKVAIHSNYDICLVSSMSVAPHYAEAFRQPLDRFRSDIGIPRTDVLFGEAHIATVVDEVRRRYAIPFGRRVILYAPTFRGDSQLHARYDGTLDLARMRAVLGDDHVILIRLHPFIRQAAPIAPELAGFAIDVSDHPDINELLLASDALITDYSSVIYEFALLERPMVFFVPDQDAYELERGFFFDFRSGVPGPIFETTEPLASYIRAGVFDLDRVRAFRSASFDAADGHATDRFIDLIVLPTLGAAL